MKPRKPKSDLTSDPSSSKGPPPAAFVTTQWTRVLEARGDSPEAKVALSDLCAAYYAPVFAFIRRDAPTEDAARELTQEFFSRLLAKPGFNSIDPQRGRFRSYLLGAVKNSLSDARDHDRRLKRGAGVATEPLESGTDTSPGLQLPDPAAPNPEAEFDRKWALTVLDRALTLLAHEHAAPDRAAQFQSLKPWLTGDADGLSQADAALALGLNEGAVKVAIHRLRRRFRELVKAEVGSTLADPTQAADELACLVAALGGGR